MREDAIIAARRKAGGAGRGPQDDGAAKGMAHLAREVRQLGARPMPRQSRVPAAFIRGGTSNAVVFDRRHLPDDEAARESLFIAALGSPDPYGRQLDGMGGGISSLSKVCIVGPPSRPDADVDYTFGQVAVDRAHIDWSSNCGNMSSAIGPFAVDEGLVDAAGPQGVVLIHNTNTGKLIRARFPVEDGRAEVEGDTAIPGVAGAGAPVDLEFLDPGGAGTGALLPTGNVLDVLEVEGVGRVPASLVDAANAFVFVDAGDMGITGSEAPAALDARPEVMDRLERVRAAAAVAMGIAASPAEASSRFPSAPKIGIAAPPRPAETLSGEAIDAAEGDLTARMVSMNNVHRALPLTGVLGFAVAAAIEGSVVARAASGARDADRRGRIRLISPSGVIRAAAEVRRAGSGGGWRAEHASVRRTQRRLFDGFVYVPAGRAPGLAGVPVRPAARAGRPRAGARAGNRHEPVSQPDLMVSGR